MTVYHLGPFGQFLNLAGGEVPFVHLPATVVSTEAGTRRECYDATDLRAILTAHNDATGRHYSVEDVLDWALDQSSPMTCKDVTSNLFRTSVDARWFTY
ncbi:hypothetical protein [Rhodovulum sp. P5]|uniref:hypothetical protein n=1 Tax=Rhodovulum sp. P5 TaxID=1564506 RepID=UPI0009DA5EDB|nr:hypothetical protein [Rhodovulum sp. P5]